jgi:hypothetical protein
MILACKLRLLELVKYAERNLAQRRDVNPEAGTSTAAVGCERASSAKATDGCNQEKMRIIAS